MAISTVIDEKGKERKKDDVDFVDDIIKLKNSKGIWPVIDKLIERWLKEDPDEVQALKIQIADHREMLDDKEFGQTKEGKDMERRFSLVFPIRLMLLIRTVFSTEELDFDNKFYKDFAKRYPNFKVAEKN